MAAPLLITKWRRQTQVSTRDSIYYWYVWVPNANAIRFVAIETDRLSKLSNEWTSVKNHNLYRVSQEERSIFWEVIVWVILSKMFIWTCVLFRTVSEMYNRKIVDKKEILRVRTVSNTGIYCSSDRVGTVYNKCSKIPPSTSLHFATRVKTWRVVRLSASWRSFMQPITSSVLTSSSSRVSIFFSVHFTLH